MSQLVARILWTVLLFPSATLVLFVSFFFIQAWTGRGDDKPLFWGGVVAAFYMVGYWLTLWWGAVAWTAARVRLSWWSGVAAAACGTAVALSLRAVIPYSADTLGGLFGALTAAVLWIIATIALWRETPAERGARVSRAGADAVVCPACGYNMTGLREARCPECGATFTLNELFAAQPSRLAAGDVEGG